MKKSAIAVVFAATIGPSAHAQVTDIQLFIGSSDLELPCNPLASGPNAPYVTGLVLSSAGGSLDMDGKICLNPGTGVSVALILDLSGTSALNGTTFDSGTIEIDVDSGSGYAPYATINASITSIPCLSNMTGHLGMTGTVRNNTTFGLHLPPPGIVSPLPGLWNPPATTGINDAVCVVNLFGQSAGLYLES